MNSIDATPIPVIITVRGEQYFDGVDPDATELMTEGTLTATGDELRISYEETALTGMEGTTTTFTVRGPRVILSRTGTVNSQMVFEEGRRHLSMYETPYGSMSVGINTRRVKSTIGETGGDLEIDYAIEIDNLMVGRNYFSMNVKRDTALKQ